METRANRLGLVLFFIYTAIYTGFVLINAVAPTLMESTPIAGINLAILSGFGLIIVAFVLAMIYGVVTGQQDRRSDRDARDRQSSRDGGAA